ncbi:HK97 family phage prohead protease [Thalassovita sp.]|uniref:HK97 family phage prohead protease n=1 Tax=Thalassovita sp. TaxID=1979401 RepID=UPI0028822B97|nr:HK97 family phage prohead protease [Thalassovita sp.]MDF1801567.1 HK97 family phage prohead protease [Thalassovita sp.]
MDTGLEHKFCRLGGDDVIVDGLSIEGYASLFGQTDQGGDMVRKGAYGASLTALGRAGRSVKMLWQHDPAQPIGVWDELREDDKGLFVKGRLLDSVEKGREAAALIEAGAIEGLSIGYRTKRAVKSPEGKRILTELELWEVSLVTFPMLPSARVAAKSEDQDSDLMQEVAAAFDGARRELARG